MIFCLTNNIYAEMTIRMQYFPFSLKNHLIFHSTVKTGKKKVDRLFQTLELNLGCDSEYKLFLKRCKKATRFGKIKYIEPCSIPNLNRFFKRYTCMNRQEKKEIRDEIYHCTQGDLNLILSEIYQRGIRMES
jgi:hypothetical protein